MTTHGCGGDSGYAVNHIPPNVEQIFTDIGDEIYHGGVLKQCAPHANPCRQVWVRVGGSIYAFLLR